MLGADVNVFLVFLLVVNKGREGVSCVREL